MARDAVTVTAIPKNTATNTPTGTAINTTNGAYLVAPAKCRNLVITVTNTITNATKTVTVPAGDNPPAINSGVGSLALVVPASGSITTTIESARHMQSDGQIYFDFSTGMTGAVWALSLSDGAA
jgi:hypothetical protein